MQLIKRATLPVVVLTLLSISPTLFAQRPLCNQLPVADRDRARVAGLCRDPAPIIDVGAAPARRGAATDSSFHCDLACGTRM